jgi:hypothetical protein
MLTAHIEHKDYHIAEITPDAISIHFRACGSVRIDEVCEPISIEDNITIRCAAIAETPNITDLVAQFSGHLARIWSEGHKWTRDVAMQSHFANAERHFGRIAPAQEQFARRLFSAEIDGSPIVFESARSYGVAECPDPNCPILRGVVPILPLYARSIVRFVNGHYTCLRSLEHVDCYRLIFTGFGIALQHKYLTQSGLVQSEKPLKKQSHMIHKVHQKWFNHNKMVPNYGGTHSRCHHLVTSAHEILITMDKEMHEYRHEYDTDDLDDIAYPGSFPTRSRTHPERGIATMVITTAREHPQTFANARVIIDVRARVAEIANMREEILPDHIMYDDFEQYVAQTLAEYSQTDEYITMRSSARSEDKNELAKSVGEITFEQWYGV